MPALPVKQILFQSESKAVTDALDLVKNARNLQPDWISEEPGILQTLPTGLEVRACTPEDQPLGCTRGRKRRKWRKAWGAQQGGEGGMSRWGW